MKKKVLSIALALALALSLSACGGGGEEAETENTEAQQENSIEQESEEEKKENDEKDEILVKVDELPFKIVKMDAEPDSVGNVWVTYTYTNNSEYPVKFYEITAKLKDTNEKTYYNCVDTVMPGDTSSNFEGVAPNNSDENDIEYLNLDYTLVKDGIDYQISYDFKLDQYEQLKINE